MSMDKTICGAGGGGGSAHTPVEAPDSLHSLATFRILDLISEGEIGGLVNGQQSIYLNQTPLANADGTLNFQNVQVDSRNGTQTQDPIKGYTETDNEISVGVELKSGTPWVQSISDLELSAVRITLGWPALSKANTSNGDINGYSISYHMDLQVDGGAWTTVYTSAVTGKTTSKYQRSTRIDLPAATTGWAIRVVRDTPNQNSSSIADTMTVDSYAEIVDGKLRYPNSALVAVAADAKQFDNIPTRAYDVFGRIIQVPSNYDPVARAYSGTWDGTFKPSWTDNPAWVYYDLATNDRFGLGGIMGQPPNKWDLYRIAQYCDELVDDGFGGQEPRFTFSNCFNSQDDAFKVLQDLASVFRGITFWSGSALSVSADMPADPVYVYAPANVINGQFTYQSTPKNQRFTTALVTWLDPSNFYTASQHYVQNDDGLARYGIVPTTLTALGATTQGQAHRAGLWALLTAQNETQSVSFSVGLDGLMAAPGQIIRIADPGRAGKRQGGRLSAATATSITVDRLPDVVAVGDSLTVILPSGVSETHAIAAMNGNTISIASPGFTETPVADAMWTSESATLVAQLFRVTNVKENKSDSSLTFDITAVQHVPGKYANIDSGTILTLPPISQLPSAVQPPPTNVTVSSHVVVTQGAANPVMTIAWDVAAGATHYQVEWQRDNVQWTTAGTVTTASIDVPGIYSGSYIARVTAFNAGNVASLPAVSAATTIAGKTEPPPPPTLTATGGQLEIKLTWAWPTGVNVEDTSYTEVWVSDDSTMADGSSVGAVAYPGTTYTITGLLPEDARYAWVRLVDKSGNVGAWSLPANAVGGTVTDLFQPLQDQVTQLNTDVGTVQTDVNNAVASITQEVSDRTAGDAANASAITQEQTDRAAAVQAQAAALAQEVSDRTTAVQAEADARVQGLQQEASDRAAAISAEATARGAAITTETTARQNADSSLSNRIDTNTAAVGTNTAAIQTEQTARVSGDTSEANSRELLATQMRGGYTGTDLTQVTAGLIAAERDARTTQDQSIVTQMTLLSAGVGEQFDYAKIWYFTNTVEGWTGGVAPIAWNASWVRQGNGTGGTYLVSPRGLAINSTEYSQFRLRVRKTGNPQWVGTFGFYAAGAGGASYYKKSIPEPSLDANGIGVIMDDFSGLTWAPGGTGPTFDPNIDGLIVILASVNSATDYYEMDWIAVGRPAPGASSAALADEETARATADTAEATARQTLSVKLVGQADPTGVTIDNIASGLLSDEKTARVNADGSQVSRIATMEARMPSGSGALANSADVTNEATTRATADTALGQRIDTVNATVGANTAAINTEQTARADGDSANATAIGNLQSTANNIQASQPQVLYAMDTLPGVTSGAANAALVTGAGTTGPNVMRCTGPVGVDRTQGATSFPLVRYDPGKLYRIRFGVKTGSKAGAVIYCGITPLKADGTNVMPSSGEWYVVKSGAISDTSTYHVYEGWFTGNTGSVAQPGSASSMNNPAIAPAGTVQFALEFLVNWGQDATYSTDVDFISLDVYDRGTALAISANTAAITNEATTRASADSALSTQLTSLTTTVNGKANQSALDSLSSTVTSQGDTLTSQGTSITSLQSSLDTTNGNVTTAQTTANNAATAAASAAGIANGKGKVLIQSTAPAAADQLAQNLWIDTTGGANTPKRWSGSAWVAVTDKTATDAAAAAAAAQTAASAAQQAASTNAGAISSMQSTVTQQGNTITAQGQSITALQGTVGQNTSAITAEQTARADGDSANTSAINALSSSFSNSKTDAGSLLPDYKMADPTAWTSHYGASVDLTPNFITVTDGQISNTVAHHTTGNFFNYSKTMLPMVAGESYVISGWWRASTDANGNNGFNWLYYNADGSPNSTTGGYGYSNIVVPKTNTWTQFSVKYNADTALANGIAFVEFGFYTNHTGTAGYAETQGMRVVKVIKSTDTDTSIATSASVTSEATTRAAADGALSTQLNTVQATANAAATQASLNSEVSTRAAADTAIASDVALLGAHNANKSAFVLNQNTVQVDGSTTFAQMLTGINATASANTSAASAAQTSATNAANAAAAASGIANGKADVLIQSTAPSAAMQKATTLWIDTTGNTNTPKRWSGSAWVAVTDKAATDAASAAAAAQAAATAAQTDATQALANINTEATTRADADTALGQRIDSVNATVGANTAAISTEQTARADGDSANASAITAVQAGMVASGENLFPDTAATLDAPTYWARNNSGMSAAVAGIDTFGHYIGLITNGTSGACELYSNPAAYALTASPGAYSFGVDVWNAGAPAGGVVVGLNFYDANSTQIGTIRAVDNNPSALYHRLTATGIAPAGTTSYLVVLLVNDGSTFAEADFKRIKVERGTVATAYTPDTTSIANASAVQQLTAGTTIGGAAYAAATVMVDANGHIGGTRLASDGTTSSFIISADQFGIVSPTGTGQRTEFSDGNWRVYDSAGTLRVALGVNI